MSVLDSGEERFHVESAKTEDVERPTLNDRDINEPLFSTVLDNAAKKSSEPSASPLHDLEENSADGEKTDKLTKDVPSGRRRSSVIPEASMEIGKRVRKQKRFSDDFVTLPVKRGKADPAELAFVDRALSPQRKKARSASKPKSASKAKSTEKQAATGKRKAQENASSSAAQLSVPQSAEPMVEEDSVPAPEPVTSGQFKIKLKPTGINRFKVTSSAVEEEKRPAKRKRSSDNDSGFEMTIASMPSEFPETSELATSNEAKPSTLPHVPHLKRPRSGTAYRNWFDCECARLEVESPELLNTPNFCALMASGWKRLSRSEKAQWKVDTKKKVKPKTDTHIETDSKLPSVGEEATGEEQRDAEGVLEFSSVDDIDFYDLFSSYPLPTPESSSLAEPLQPMDVACSKLKWWRTLKKREPRKNSRKSPDESQTFGQTSLDTCALLTLMSEFFEQLAGKMIAPNTTRQELSSNAHADLFMNSVFVSMNQMLTLLQIVPDLNTKFLEALKQCMDNVLVTVPIA